MIMIAGWIQAGARLHPTLAPAHIVLGIKETPIRELEGLVNPIPLRLPSHEHDSTQSRLVTVPRTHMMFSHTHKGQAYNMVLLDQFLNQREKGGGGRGGEGKGKPTLIDYELLTDGRGKRTVGFGWYAGGAWSASLSVLHPSL